LDTKFSSYLVKTKAPGILTVAGSKIKFQNGFGAMQFMKYQCDYDVKKKKVSEGMFAVMVSPKN
jgi:hypothetical protein